MSPSRRIVVMNPQGHMNLYADEGRRPWSEWQTKTTEEGGQVGFVYNTALAFAEMHDYSGEPENEVIVFARNYDSDDIYVEPHRDFPNLKIVHIPIGAIDPDQIQHDEPVDFALKEDAYPGYPRFLAETYRYLTKEWPDMRDNPPDIIGHYADGAFQAAALSRLLAQDGVDSSVVNVAHSLEAAKRDKLKNFIAATSDKEDLVNQKLQEEIQILRMDVRRFIEQAAFERGADGTVSISDELTDWLTQHYGTHPERVTLIPGGADPKVFSKHSKEPCSFPGWKEIAGLPYEPYPVIMGYGRPTAAKGFEKVAEAVEMLKEEFPRMLYVYFGVEDIAQNGAARRCMARAETNGYENNIRFLPGEKQNVINDLMGHADIEMFSALFEPWGLVPIEMMLTGKPTIVSNQSGFGKKVEQYQRETGEETAMLVDPNYPERIADAIRALIHNPDKAAELAEKGHDFAQHYTWLGNALQTLAFIDKVKSLNVPRASNGLAEDAQQILEKMCGNEQNFANFKEYFWSSPDNDVYRTLPQLEHIWPRVQQVYDQLFDDIATRVPNSYIYNSEAQANQKPEVSEEHSLKQHAQQHQTLVAANK